MKLYYLILLAGVMYFFSSCDHPCNPPDTLIIDTLNCDTASCNVTLKWNAVPNATAYLVKTTNSDDSTFSHIDPVNGPDTTITLFGIQSAQAEFSVASICKNDTSKYGNKIPLSGVLVADADLEVIWVPDSTASHIISATAYDAIKLNCGITKCGFTEVSYMTWLNTPGMPNYSDHLFSFTCQNLNLNIKLEQLNDCNPGHTINLVPGGPVTLLKSQSVTYTTDAALRNQLKLLLQGYSGLSVCSQNFQNGRIILVCEWKFNPFSVCKVQ